MFYIPFWIYIAVAVALAGITIGVRKLRFIDIQVMIMIVAVSMSCDMLFCKQFKLYHYVDMTLKYIGWYSFWANIVACPAMGLIFIKFIPSTRKKATLYIITWSAFFTLLELYILKPAGILHTPGWRTIPWSPIGYFLVLILEYFYYKTLEKRLLTIPRRMRGSKKRLV